MYHLLPNYRPINGAELGVAEAKLTVKMLDRLPNLHLVLVDPWEPYQDWWGPIEAASQNVNERIAMSSLEPYQGRYELLKEYTDTAHEKMQDGSFDFIYIDADHSYGWVTHDLQCYWPKVAKGGILCGHDRSLPEVHKALTDFCRDFRLQFTPTEEPQKDSWFIVKSCEGE
jgi:predicted O-methyltransferase YrrM